MGLTCSQLGFQSVPGLRWPELPMCYQTSSPEFFPARLFAVSGEGIPSKKVSLVVTTEDMPHHLPFSHFKLVETKSSQDEKRLLSTRVRNKKDSADIYPVLLITDKKKNQIMGQMLTSDKMTKLASQPAQVLLFYTHHHLIPAVALSPYFKITTQPCKVPLQVFVSLQQNRQCS